MLDSRLLGSATHLVIAALDLSGPVTKDTIETAIEELAADGALSATVAGRIDTDSILTFFQGDLGQLALDTENRVHREWPFTFALPASEWHSPSDARQTMDDGGQTTGGSLKRSLGMANDVSRFTLHEIRDTIVVQGIIDMLIQTPQGLVVIDFKTDNITASQALDRAELYRTQLDAYAKAAGKILNAESIAEHLYFLTPRVVVRL